MKKLGEHLDLPQTSRANSQVAANPVNWHSTNNKRVSNEWVKLHCIHTFICV